MAGLPAADPLTSDTIWGLDELPARLVVLGGGPIGCELGQAFARLGSMVMIVEAPPALVPRERAEVGTFLAECLRGEGVDVRTGLRAESVTADGEGSWALRLDDGTTVGFDRILVAVGRRPNTAESGLDEAGVELDERGHVVTDDRLATTGDHI
ncbi:MAG: FAD-dependent oxidoreductase [Acidimicrobiales bacterium]